MQKTCTDNEAIEMMHKQTAFAFRKVADFVEKHQLDYKEVVEFLRDAANDSEAQAAVVKLRDELHFTKPNN